MTKLHSSKAEAEVHLKERISQGRILLDKNVVIPNDFESFKKEFNAWNNYNKELLNKLFNDNKISEEYKFCALREVIRPQVYDNSMVVDLRSMRVRLKAKTDKLEDILGRLNLYINGTQGDSVKKKNNECKEEKPITEDNLRDVTPIGLIKSAKRLSLGAWLLLIGILGIVYEAGLHANTDHPQFVSKDLPFTIDNRKYTNFTVQNLTINGNELTVKATGKDIATGNVYQFESRSALNYLTDEKGNKLVDDKGNFLMTEKNNQ